MPDLTITISLDGKELGHTCRPDCDCPRAMAATQQAIDWDRAERGAEPRALSERLRGMRHGAPEPEWFDAMAQRADALETACGIPVRPAGAQAADWAARADAEDAMTPGERLQALHAAVEATVRDLERAALIPSDHEYVHARDIGESHVWAGNRKLTAGITGTLDTPVTRYIVTTSDDADDDEPAEQIVHDIDQVRALLLAWGAQATYDQRAADARETVAGD